MSGELNNHESPVTSSAWLVVVGKLVIGLLSLGGGLVGVIYLDSWVWISVVIGFAGIGFFIAGWGGHTYFERGVHAAILLVLLVLHPL